MESTKNILNNYGVLGVELLKQSIAPLRATGKTEASIRYEIQSTENSDRLLLLARGFFETLETGRGPRKSQTEGGFTDAMYEYIQARGIGADLSEKKRRQLARFMAWKINREGDRTFKVGGRTIYSDDLNRYIDALKSAIKKDYVNFVKVSLRNAFKDGSVNS